MVGDGIKIERCRHLDLVSRGVLDRLTLCKAVGIIRRGGGAEVIGVKGVLSVHMKIAKQTHFFSTGSGQRQQAGSENKTFTHNASLSLLLSDREFTRHRLPPAPLIHGSTPRSDA